MTDNRAIPVIWPPKQFFADTEAQEWAYQYAKEYAIPFPFILEYRLYGQTIARRAIVTVGFMREREFAELETAYQQKRQDWLAQHPDRARLDQAIVRNHL